MYVPFQLCYHFYNNFYDKFFFENYTFFDKFYRFLRKYVTILSSACDNVGLSALKSSYEIHNFFVSYWK